VGQGPACRHLRPLRATRPPGLWGGRGSTAALVDPWLCRVGTRRGACDHVFAGIHVVDGPKTRTKTKREMEAEGRRRRRATGAPGPPPMGCAAIPPPCDQRSGARGPEGGGLKSWFCRRCVGCCWFFAAQQSSTSSHRLSLGTEVKGQRRMGGATFELSDTRSEIPTDSRGFHDPVSYKRTLGGGEGKEVAHGLGDGLRPGPGSRSWGPGWGSANTSTAPQRAAGVVCGGGGGSANRPHGLTVGTTRATQTILEMRVCVVLRMDGATTVPPIGCELAPDPVGSVPAPGGRVATHSASDGGGTGGWARWRRRRQLRRARANSSSVTKPHCVPSTRSNSSPTWWGDGGVRAPGR